MKRSLMAVLVMLFVGCMLAGCGGGGSDGGTSVPESDLTTPDDGSGSVADTGGDDTAADSKPEIVDNYYDSCFKYVNQELYNGTYDVVPEVYSSCETILGKALANQMTASDITAGSVSVTINDSVETFAAVPDSMVGEYDMWGYAKLYSDYVCVTVFGSANLEDGTNDVMGFSCVKNDKSDLCATVFKKPSGNDFTSTAIKNVNRVAFGIDEFVKVLEDIAQNSQE